MKILYLVFLIPTFSCTSNTRQQTNITQNIHYDTSNIAIIQFDTSMRWLSPNSDYTNYYLTQQDLSDIEQIFNQSVNEHNSSLSTGEAKKFSSIYLKKGEYKRQYVSVINGNGEKLVYINCFCGGFTSINWKKYLEGIQDGGSCAFRLTINLSTKKYYSFEINGFA